MDDWMDRCTCSCYKCTCNYDVHLTYTNYIRPLPITKSGHYYQTKPTLYSTCTHTVWNAVEQSTCILDTLEPVLIM